MILMPTKCSSRLGVVAVTLCMTVAYASPGDPVGRMLGSRDETSTRPELVRQASEFGGIVLPPGASVRFVHLTMHTT